MPGVPDRGLSVCEAPDLQALPPDALALFGQDFFSTLGWYRTSIAHALPPGTRPVFVVVHTAENQRLAVFPMQRGPQGLSALTTPYTCLWRPLLRHGADPKTLFEIGRAFGRFCRHNPVTRLDAMETDCPAMPGLLAGARAAGLLPLRFNHFGNWHIATGGLGWEAFLAGRPGALREAVRRRGKRLLKQMGASFSVTHATAGIEPAIAAYETIYAASWKEPEPFADFTAALIRACAADGTLRLGLLQLEETPIAAQLWVVRDGIAAVLKLAHDESLRALSPGTVLTALMIQRMLDQEGAHELDFGRGDDDYKKLWTGERRQRIGIVLANPLTIGGAAAISRHVIGTWRRKLA